MTHDLAGPSRPEEIGAAAARRLTEVMNADTVVWLTTSAGVLSEPAEAAPGDLEVARWVVAHRHSAGLGEKAFPQNPALYVPLIAGNGIFGVAGVRPRSGAPLSEESIDLLQTLAGQIAVSVERAHLAAQAEKADLGIERERLRNALLSSVSHDLRTPLSVITGAASSLVTDGSLSEATRHELGATIYEESEHLNRLVGNLLDMTRVEAGELRVTKEWHSLEEIVGTAVRRLKKVLREHVVQAVVPSDLPLVPLDAVLIEQVFVNLLENAAKYTPAGSRIEIAARRAERVVTVEVADAGPGLPAGDIGRLFEKFHHGGRGVGLGLAICRAIVSAHGGAISAQNRPEGGAVFTVTLPLEDGARPLSAEVKELDESR
jgi:two-component system sensor histidine kinase KdpD